MKKIIAWGVTFRLLFLAMIVPNKPYVKLFFEKIQLDFYNEYSMKYMNFLK